MAMTGRTKLMLLAIVLLAATVSTATVTSSSSQSMWELMDADAPVGRLFEYHLRRSDDVIDEDPMDTQGSGDGNIPGREDEQDDKRLTFSVHQVLQSLWIISFLEEFVSYGRQWRPL